MNGESKQEQKELDMEKVSEEIDRYVISNNLSEHTGRNYKIGIKHILSYIGKHPDNIEEDDIEDYKFWAIKHSDVSPSTAGSYLDRLSTYLKNCRGRYQFAQESINTKGLGSESEPDWFNHEEIKEVLEKCSNPKEKYIVGTGYYAGMRIGESSSLETKNINDVNNQVRIISGKGDKDRTVPVPGKLIEIIDEYEEWLENVQPMALPEFWPWTADTMREKYYDILRRTSMFHFGAKNKELYDYHSLRHTYGTHLYMETQDIHKVKELMGHSDIETTLKYMRMAQTLTEEDVEAFVV